jgi:ATP-binding cassette subfamily C exporter for protease/lipase
MKHPLPAGLQSLRFEWGAVLVFSLVANLLMLTPSIYMLQVFDRVLLSGSSLTLLTVSLVGLGLLLMMAFADWSRARVLVRTGVQLDIALGQRVFHAAFQARQGAGPQAASPQALVDLRELRQFLTGSGLIALLDAPWTPLYIGVLYLLHPWLGAFAVLFVVVQVLLAWLGHGLAVAPNAAASQAQRSLDADLQQQLRHSEAVAAMGMWQALRARWLARHQGQHYLHGVAQAQSHRITAWSKWVRYAQQSLGLGVAAWLVVRGELSPGAMIASNLLLSRALAPVDQLVGQWRSVLGARSAYQRLWNLLGQPAPASGFARLAHPRGQLALRQLTATAPGRPSPILSAVNWLAGPGSVTVVMGPSGSGKSTLAKVMVGAWPAADVSGEVLLDGLPLGAWDRNELGPFVGYLPQEVALFDGSIAQNIARMGEVSSEPVIAAARLAGLHELILRLPQGYETQVSQAGGSLSAGWRQRIGLARALYGTPVVVVLDEPNAHLDEAGDAALAQAVRAMKARDSTVVLVSHRPSVLGLADRVLVLDDGQVRLAGPRDEVLTQWQLQRAAAAAANNTHAPLQNPRTSTP